MTNDRICINFEVSDPGQAQELEAAWQEIVAGKRVRLEMAAQQLDDIMERARFALQRIVTAIEAHPGSGQGRRLVAFLASIYNGVDYQFDPTDLRTLDTDLASACIDYLNYDRLSKAEVHTHLPGKGREMQGLLKNQGLRARLRLSESDEHEARLRAVAARARENPERFLKEALDDFLYQHESKTFGGLAATDPSPDGDPPFVHARLLGEPKLVPVCGAEDGPWMARAFDFSRTCRERLSIVRIDDELLAQSAT